MFFPYFAWNTWDKKKAFNNCRESIAVIRGLILTSSSSYALKVGLISPDLRHLDLNLSPLTFILGNGKDWLL